jgi:multicomponent Na+:H+ antiporter subunit E
LRLLEPTSTGRRFRCWAEHGSSDARRSTRIEISDAQPVERRVWPDIPVAGQRALARPTALHVGFACWIRPLSATAGSASFGLARAAVVRAAFFLVFWLMISGWAPADLPVGLAAVAGATWTSLRFLPPKRSPFRLAPLAALATSFLRQSVVSGTAVAWRALDPSLKLRPGFVACPLRLPPGGERSAFCALSSLMPGTLPTGTDEHGALLVHCLDVGQPVAANLAAEERLFIRAVGGD